MAIHVMGMVLIMLKDTDKTMCRGAIIGIALFSTQSLPSMAVESAVLQPRLVSAQCDMGFGRVFSGMASWYGRKFHGRKTASGKIFDENEYTCAHRTLPFGTRLLVTNPETGAQCYVTVTDRGPFHGHRVLDLSKAAAHKIGLTGVGRVVVSTGHYIADKIEHKKASVQTASSKPAAKEPVSEKQTATVVQKQPATASGQSEKNKHSLASREIAGGAKHAKAAPGDEMAKYLNSPYYVIEDSD